MFVDLTGADRASLDYALTRAPPHLHGLYLAVRDGGCAYMIAAQSRRGFAIATDRPAIVVIGDDLHRSMGPGGFHAKSLERFLPRIGAAFIMAGEPVVSVYDDAAAYAVGRRRDVAVIETQPEHEAEWVRLIEALVPTAAVTLCSPTVPGIL